jgi:putative NADH-flavin reductase
MKIAVLAANGRSGKAFVMAAVSLGHTLRAGVHNNSNFKDVKGLEVINCNALDLSEVKNLITGQDAVVSFIGHVRGSDPEVQTKAMAILEKAMSDCGIKRLISLTGTGVRFAGDKITLIDRVLNLSIGVIDRKRISDGKNHVKLLENSRLDWTIIRVLKLQNNKPSRFKLSLNGPAKTIVSRGEVALAALEILENNSFVHQAPIISKP